MVLLANIVAMLFQALSAKLGIVTGRNLAEMCREHFSKPVVWALWIVSEVAAMATDLAELCRENFPVPLVFAMWVVSEIAAMATDLAEFLGGAIEIGRAHV